jgi:hypothetical protein
MARFAVSHTHPKAWRAAMPLVFVARSCGFKKALTMSSATGCADVEQPQVGKMARVLRFVAQRLDERPLLTDKLSTSGFSWA